MAGLAAPACAQDLTATPKQRIGPFYPPVDEGENRVDLTRRAGASRRAHGQLVEISGRVLDPHARPIGSALLLVWQADAMGYYDHPGDAARSQRDPAMAGHVVLRTARDGSFHLTTVKPGAYADDRSSSGLRTPHVHYEVIGEEGRLITEMYFPDEPLNARDANIAEMVAAGADPRLLTARLDGSAQESGAMALTWDIILSRR